MAAHSGSILRKLQLGFAALAMALAGGMALLMDQALVRSLEAEDAQVMEGQARAMLQRLEAGLAPGDSEGAPRPEKASWRLLDAQGRRLAESRELANLPDLHPTSADRAPREIRLPNGRIVSLLSRPWKRGDAEGSLLLVLDRGHEEALIKDFRRLLALGVLVAVASAVLLARAVASWGLAPLRALMREAESISDRSLHRRLASEHFPRELQELVATLNAALSRLEEAFERLGSLGAELAHELRTPLQNLRSTLENRVLCPDTTPRDMAELGALIEECDRMASLIEQILFLARTEHGAAELALEHLEAAAFLEEVRAFFEATAEESGVALVVEADPLGGADTNRLLLTRALHNLVANALRHTPPGGTVRLEACREEARLCLAVRDEGPGIPDEWLPRLGTPFLRPPQANPAEGHGLGLAIVKRIAHMLRGEFALSSARGEGTRAELRIPTI